MMAPVLSIKNLDVRLGVHHALVGVSFELPEGCFAAVLGPNGAGKSTLLRVLLGIIEAQSGEIELWGESWSREISRAIGYVPQAKAFDRRFPARALDLVATGLLARWPARLTAPVRDRCLGALSEIGAEHLADRSLGVLSGGEMQRVYLARALVRRPRLLLLDEPATGVDRPAEADLIHLLEEYRAAEGCALIMVTHDWGIAEYHASHVVVLNKELIHCGPPQSAMVDAVLGRAFGHTGHVHRHPAAGFSAAAADGGGCRS